ncbi:MAG TPA: hypothetical protein VF331_15395 [Polyangiales bacterium]
MKKPRAKKGATGGQSRSKSASPRSSSSAKSRPAFTVKLPPDWSEFIGCLSSHRVRFLIVGAHALAANGRPRATQDIDFLVEPTQANARRLGAALADFGFAALAQQWREFAKPDRMATLGEPPLRIDVMTTITGVTFAAAWKGRLRASTGAHEIGYLGRRELEQNKQATGRAKDRADLALLAETDDSDR